MNISKKAKWFLITKQIDARQKFCCGRFWKKFRTVDLAYMMWVDERYIVVGEQPCHQAQRCYGKGLGLIADCKKYRFIPKSTLRAMVFVAIGPAGRSDLVILMSRFKINFETYIKICLKPLLASPPPYQNLKKIIFHQDHAPAHRIRKTQPFLEEISQLFV